MVKKNEMLKLSEKYFSKNCICPGEHVDVYLSFEDLEGYNEIHKYECELNVVYDLYTFGFLDNYHYNLLVKGLQASLEEQRVKHNL